MADKSTEATEETNSDTKQEVVVPEKFKDLVKTIEQLTVLELSELVAVLEDTFGVSAAAPMAMAMGPAVAADAGAGLTEKTSFTVELTSAGEQKIAVIKAVRAITELGLKDAKDLVEKAPTPIKENVPKAEAEEIKQQIEAAGGKVELK